MIVVDASVAIKWVFDEEYGDQARRILDEPDVPVAPNLLLIEAGNALWKRVRRGELASAEAIEMLTVLKNLPVGWIEESGLVEPALDLAARLQHPIYDCVYLALALREDIRIATADARFAAVMMRHGFGDRLRLIGDPIG
jgi:predicted nucleic acid-binding protein